MCLQLRIFYNQALGMKRLLMGLRSYLIKTDVQKFFLISLYNSQTCDKRRTECSIILFGHLSLYPCDFFCSIVSYVCWTQINETDICIVKFCIQFFIGIEKKIFLKRIIKVHSILFSINFYCIRLTLIFFLFYLS